MILLYLCSAKNLKNMNKNFTYLFLILFSFVSVDLMSQSVKVTAIRSESQLISGVNVVPNTSKLQKAVPVSIINHEIDIRKKIEEKPVIEKPLKVSKYNNIKAKRDED